MGFLVWFIIGIVIAALLGRVTGRRLTAGLFGLAILGAVLGGYIVDLTLRGDSVVNFRGPTVIGATVGAILVVGAAYAARRSRSPNRPAG